MKIEELKTHINICIDEKHNYITYELDCFHRKYTNELANHLYENGYHMVTVDDFLTLVRFFVFEKDKR